MRGVRSGPRPPDIGIGYAGGTSARGGPAEKQTPRPIAGGTTGTVHFCGSSAARAQRDARSTGGRAWAMAQHAQSRGPRPPDCTAAPGCACPETRDGADTAHKWSCTHAGCWCAGGGCPPPPPPCQAKKMEDLRPGLGPRQGEGGGKARSGCCSPGTGRSPSTSHRSQRSTKAAALAHRCCCSIGGGAWHQHIEGSTRHMASTFGAECKHSATAECPAAPQEHRQCCGLGEGVKNFWWLPPILESSTTI